MIERRRLRLDAYRGARARASRLKAKRDLRRGIAELDAQESTRTRLLRSSLKRALEAPNAAASSALNRIEELRRQLECSQQVVEFTDFGAGRPESARSDSEMREGVSERVVVGERCKSASQPAFWCRVLFEVVSEIAPSSALEMGTFLGISAAYQATALALAGDRRLLTLEGSEPFADLARTNFRSLGLNNVDVVTGRFDDTLGDAIVKLGSVDYAFVDGHHDEHATMRYWAQLKPRLSSSSTLVFDDIHWTPGMERAWRAISTDPVTTAAVDVGKLGVVLTG